MFGNTGIGSGPFSDTLNFEVPELGSVSSSITSVAISLLTDVSFSSVTLNGHEFHIDEIGATENRSFLNLPVTSGMHILVINGTSGGRRSYSGTLAFAVPQPASRSEEHTSELQSLMRISYAVFCLKKKTKN